MKIARELYCQYLLSSQINHTCTNLAKHLVDLSHNDAYRYLKEEKLTPSLLWGKLKLLLTSQLEGYLLFDDVVLEQPHAKAIDGVRRQYCDNQHGVVVGIGVVNCIYYDPVKDQFWMIDYRLFDP